MYLVTIQPCSLDVLTFTPVSKCHLAVSGVLHIAEMHSGLSLVISIHL